MGSGKHYSVLNQALACGKSAKFRELKIKREYPERGRYDLLRDLCNHFAWYIDSDYKKIREWFDDNYLEGLFSLPSQYEQAREIDQFRAERGVKYFLDAGYQFEKVETFEVPINRDLNGTHFDSVVGSCFVFKKEDRFVACMVKSGIPTYSKRARRPERKVQASVELILMNLGLSDKYPGIETSMIFLNVENEKDSSMEKGLPDKNIISLNVSKQEAWRLLEERVALGEYLGCDSCSYSDLCNLGDKKEPRPEKNEASPAAKKEKLTKAQQEIVDHREGPLCCIAVPGAGKTHSLVRRLEAMVNEGISPKNILFITFTRKAAKEIKDRVGRFLEDDEGPEISTFHAFALQIIRDSADDRYRNLKLAETLEQRQLIEQVLKETPKRLVGAPKYLYGKFGLLDYIGTAFAYYEANGKEKFIGRYGARDPEGILGLYDTYRELYEAEGYISYDEMVPTALKILREHPDELLRLQNKYQYLMADEFQDVSQEQAELLYLIAKRRNLVVVGDDDQTIYSWRGGTNQYLLGFLRDWPDGKMVRMEDNFRSVDKILSAAEEVIFQNVNRISKKIIPHQHGDLRPVFLKGCRPQDYPWLLNLAMKKGYKPGDIAILARKNYELEKIADQLYQASIPFLEPKEALVSDINFIRIYDVLSLFYKEMRDDVAIYRTFTRAGCEFSEELSGSGTLYERMVEHSLMPEIEPYTTLDEFREGFESVGISEYGLCGYTLLKCFKAILYNSSIIGVLEELANCLEIERQELDAVDALVRKAEEKNLMTIKELYGYMNNMILYQDDTDIEYPEEEGKVNLLSCHKAKGKEYPLVIIHGVEDFKDTEEDRCVLYVAMTRAKRCLYLTEGPFVNSELFQDLDEDYYIIKEVAV